MDTLLQQQWLIIAAFFGIIVYIIWIRYRDRQWIKNRFGKNRAKAMSFGVNSYVMASRTGKPKSSSGFLLLLPDRLFYRSRFARLELDIPGDRIVRVYHGTGLKGVELHHSVVKIDFFDAHNEKDTVAFKVPYPPQWISAIENTLITRLP